MAAGSARVLPTETADSAVDASYEGETVASSKSPASRSDGAVVKRVAETLESLVTAIGCSPAPAPDTSCACNTDTLPRTRMAPAHNRFIIIPSAIELHAGKSYIATLSKTQAICLRSLMGNARKVKEHPPQFRASCTNPLASTTVVPPPGQFWGHPCRRKRYHEAPRLSSVTEIVVGFVQPILARRIEHVQVHG